MTAQKSNSHLNYTLNETNDDIVKPDVLLSKSDINIFSEEMLASRSKNHVQNIDFEDSSMRSRKDVSAQTNLMAVVNQKQDMDIVIKEENELEMEYSPKITSAKKDKDVTVFRTGLQKISKSLMQDTVMSAARQTSKSPDKGDKSKGPWK